jgi:hypothetical protein
MEHASGHRNCHISAEMALAGNGRTSLASRHIASSVIDCISGLAFMMVALFGIFCDGDKTVSLGRVSL